MSNQEPGDDGWVRWHWPSRRGRRDGVLGRLWRELDGHGRLLIFGGAAVLMALVGAGVAMGLTLEGDLEKECRAAAEYEGYTGVRFDQFVKDCIDAG
ncbi:Uncharacterised protein [Mycolicibacterium phlei]|uniref:hypothetical protein n=1 Tax=Mycolicibacterium phlei TaxID=1771 RepID=UPI00078C83C7|nr:hypothetical protein [Mycolicibacterium phlei]AMO61871.1 hypothetical protein MPHLCCUG_03066 [Mycolicibacterium phlei]STZ19447.1 Uncharacterised protein [Mycolicibacterium phlei]VEG09977.1 Uncharacterised protein [Mycobacteroides chelonae]